MPVPIQPEPDYMECQRVDEALFELVCPPGVKKVSVDGNVWLMRHDTNGEAIVEWSPSRTLQDVIDILESRSLEWGLSFKLDPPRYFAHVIRSLLLRAGAVQRFPSLALAQALETSLKVEKRAQYHAEN